MEVFIYIYAAVFVLLFAFLIIEYPYYMLGVLIFMMVYRFNIELPLPLDARGILTLILFLRLYFFDKKNISIINAYLFRKKIFWVIIIFSSLVLIMPIINSEKFTGFVKDIVLNIIALVLGFLLLIDKKGRVIFIYSIMAISCTSALDLWYTYIVGGGLNIIRVVDVIMGKTYILPINHNFPGMLSCLGLFFLYLLYERSDINRIFLLLTAIFLLSGVFLSTSRSALMGLFLVFILMNLVELDLRKNIKKIIIVVGSIFTILIAFFIVYNTFIKTPNSNEFVDKVYFRLFDEPMQVVGLSDSKRFDIYSGKSKQGSISFRGEKWKEDFKKFQKFDLMVQGFGIGPAEYYQIAKKEWGKWDNLKRQLVAHNGYLILLVERGIIGLLLYLVILISMTISSFNLIKQYQIHTPVIYLFLFIAIYSFTQNSELVNVYAYLLLGGILGNFYSCETSTET